MKDLLNKIPIKITIFLVFCSILSQIFSPYSVSAAVNLQFAWADQQTIKISGSSLASDVNLSLEPNNFPGMSGEVGVEEAVDKANNCYFNIQINVDTSGNARMIGVRGTDKASSGNQSSGPAACTETVWQAYSINIITFTNSRGTTSVPDETTNQKVVYISVNTKKPINEAPASITATLTPTSTSGRAVSVTLNKLVDTTASAEMNAYSYYGIAQGVDPGAYKVKDSLGVGEVDFTKVKYSAGFITYGESTRGAMVTVNVNLENYSMATNDTKILGPINLVLTPPNGGTPIGKQTNSINLEYVTNNNNDTSLGTYSNITAVVSATFTDVEASSSNYRVCVKDSTICVDFIKITGQPKTIELKLGGNLDQYVVSTSSTNDKPTCEGSIDNGFGWIICPALEGIDKFIQGSEAVIASKLAINTESFETANNGMRKIWLSIARFSSGILVLIALFMIVSTALGFDFVSSYTVKKVLPRIVIGAIGMWLSWTIVVAYIDFMNDLGRGLASIMYTAMPEAKSSGLEQIVAIAAKNSDPGTDIVSGALFVGLAMMAGAAAGLVGIAAAALAAGTAIIVGVVVLAVREILIIMAVMLAPIAIVSWILPNTNKLWKFWSSNLNKLLLMFPIIMALFASAKIMALITANAVQEGSGFLEMLFPVIIYVIPLFFLPKVFKSAGGILTGVTAAAGKFGNKATGGWRDSLKSAQSARSARKTKEGDQRLYASASNGNRIAQARLRARSGQNLLGQSFSPIKGRRDSRNRAIESGQAQLVDAFEKKQLEEAEIALRKSNSYNDATELLNISTSGSTTEAEKRAALNRLTQMKKTTELETARTSLMANPETSKVWGKHQDGKYSDMKEFAPQLVGAGFNNVSAEAAAKWTRETWNAANAADPATASKLAYSVVNNDKLKTSIGDETMATLATVASGYTPPPTPRPTVSAPPNASVSLDGNYYTTDNPSDPGAKWYPTSKS